jgi:O-antigen/teichoic acid export membrane protein
MKHFTQVLSVGLLAKVALGAVTIALIRFMPVEEYAALTFAVSAAGLAAQIFSSGFNRIYIVGYERYALAGKIGGLLLLQLAGIAVLALAFAPLAGTFRGLYIASAVFASAIMLSEFAKTYYQRDLRFGRYSAMEIGRTLLQGAAVGGLLLAYRDRLAAAPVLWAQSGALALAFCVVLWPALRSNRLTDLGSAGPLARSIAGGPYAFLFVYFSVIAVFSQVDVVMVRWLGDDRVLASYGAALRYYGVLSLALGAVHAVLLPAIQQARVGPELDALFAQHFRLVLIYAPIVVLFAAVAGGVMPWVDQGRYPDSVIAFRVLALSAVVSFAFSPHVNLLMKMERFRFLVVLVAVALVVNLALLLWLVPRQGAIGASFAVLVAAACVTVPIFLESRRLRLHRA